MPTCTPIHSFHSCAHAHMPTHIHSLHSCVHAPHSLHSCVHVYTCIASTCVHMPTCAHIHNVGVAYIRMQRAGSGPGFESQGMAFRVELGGKTNGIHMVCLPRAVPGAPTTCQSANPKVQTPYPHHDPLHTHPNVCRSLQGLSLSTPILARSSWSRCPVHTV